MNQLATTLQGNLTMGQALRLQLPLTSQLTHKAGRKSWLRQLFVVILGSLLIAISAKVNIDFQPVPLSMQTFMVLLLPMLCGWRVGSAMVALYLFEGSIGLPVFAGPVGGLGYLFGPSGGYLFGFFPAAIAVGWLTERGWGRYHLTTAIAALIGTAIIYAYGIFRLTQFMDFQQAITLGVTPFLVWDALKIAALAVVVPLFWKTKA